MYFPREDFELQARDQGRSEAFINSTLEYVDRLNSMQLPVIFSLKHLSLTLEFPYEKMLDMANNPNKYYKSFNIRKKRGGVREIQAPKPDLKIIQKWIYQQILKGIPTDISCKGYVEGSSTKNAAVIHQNQEVVLKLDISNFFESITSKQVYLVFINLGYNKHVAMDLAKLTTISLGNNKRCLPQGASTSPALSNLVVRHLDKRLRKLSDSLGVNYTRYADDLIFSGNKENMPRIGLIKQIVYEEGFKINPKKTALQKRGSRQIVLGLTVTEGVHVPKKYKKEIWTHLKYCNVFGPIQHLKNINQEDKAAYKDWLFGRICYVKSIEKEIGERMMNQFNDISWPF